MKRNVGNSDKIIRMALALVITYFAYSGTFYAAWQAYILWAVAIVLLLTAFTGRCPVFSIAGISTCKTKD